jgi:Na+/H+ antiporter NhaD/arsenite permease-like protein
MQVQLIQPNVGMVTPFVALLAAIALAPLFFSSWWSKHFLKVTLALAAIPLTYYLVGLRAHERVFHTATEYVSFICLIGSLFVISGGIHINVKGEATPGANVLFLIVGALVSNVLGTTGASMLLIRPWLRMNKYRLTAYHVIFFIFIVSNVGGSLTPVGDPPLFLGYLQGVPFWWTARELWPMWATGLGILVAMFYMVDSANFLRAPKAVREKETRHEDWRFEGLGNLFFLAVVLGSVFLKRPPGLREGLMVAAAAGSWFTTRKPVHEANDFNFGPIKEVAILFAGIFATMMPALDWLQANAARLGQPTSGLFFWGSGALSSILDNAPTYLSFLSTAFGAFATPEALAAKLQCQGVTSDNAQIAVILGAPLYAKCLKAISIGSVFFGANTYIGNGPNFMVKAIADQQKAHTPTFLGYVFKFTVPFMLPMLVIVWLLFFRG